MEGGKKLGISPSVQSRIFLLIPIAVVAGLGSWSAPAFGDACDNNQAPVADVGEARTVGIGVESAFDGGASYDPDGVVTDYWFNFGDGYWTGWQSNAVIQHTYDEEGVYQLKLWVRDACGAISPYASTLITVEEVGSAGPINRYCAGLGDMNCDGRIDNFDVNGFNLALAQPENYAATFPDCDINLADVNADGQVNQFDLDPFIERLLGRVLPEACECNLSPVADAGGDKDAEAGAALQFDGRASFDEDGSIVEYAWDFGDGYTASGAIVSHSYDDAGSYYATLTVTDDCGDESIADGVTVSVSDLDPCEGNQAPVADAGPNLAGDAGVPVAFDGSGSYDADGQIAAYQWNFGDGYTASGAQVSHSYDDAGTYYATLIVTDDCGEPSVADAVTVSISEPDPCEGNQAPVADAGPDMSVDAGQAIELDASGSIDPDGQIVEFEWDFGDGSQPADTEVVSHTYADAGDYTATLTVWDDCGESRADQVVVSVEDSGPPQGLAANFTVSWLLSVDADGTEHWSDAVDPSTVEIERGLRIKLDGSVSTGGATWFLWDFGDGTFGSNPANAAELHAFNQDRTVTLTVYTADWCQWHTVAKTVHVDAGMHQLSSTTWPGHDFLPTRCAVWEDQLWAVSAFSSLGVLDISDPESLDCFDIVLPEGSLSSVQSMAANNGKLFISRADGVVDIYLTDGFAQSGETISASDLGGAAAREIAAFEDVLFVSASDNKIHVFDTSSVSPQAMEVLDVTGGTGQLRLTNSRLLVSVSTGGLVTVFDVQNPACPVLAGNAVQLPQALIYYVAVSDDFLAARTNQGTAVLRFADYAVSADPAVQIVSQTSTTLAVNDDRLYLFDNTTGVISKYDITDRFGAAYLVQTVSTGKATMKNPFPRQTDGVGNPALPSLMIGYTPMGFMSYSP